MVDIALVKQHLRVDFDHEDNYIEDCIESAKASCYAHLNCTVCNDAEALKKAHESGDKHAILLTKDIERAILLMTGHFYESREAVQIGQSVSMLPLSVQWLLNPYRKRAGV